MGLSDAHPKALEIFLKIMQTVSWLGGLWGLFMLCGMVGNSLNTTEWKIRQKMVASLALVIRCRPGTYNDNYDLLRK